MHSPALSARATFCSCWTCLPNATSDSHFSEAIVSGFRLRPVTIGRRRAQPIFPSPGRTDWSSLPVRGSAARRNRRGAGAGRLVRGASGETTRCHLVNDEKGASSDGLRVYAGLRAEPFFLNLQGLIESQKTGRLCLQRGRHQCRNGLNVLSIVVEADCRPWLRDHGPLLGVVGETVVMPAELPIRIERIRRLPEIRTFDTRS